MLIEKENTITPKEFREGNRDERIAYELQEDRTVQYENYKLEIHTSNKYYNFNN